MPLGINASNAPTGATTLLSGSTLCLGASERLSDSSDLVLGGGTFDLAGFSGTLGALDLDASAAIPVGAFETLRLANLSRALTGPS